MKHHLKKHHRWAAIAATCAVAATTAVAVPVTTHNVQNQLSNLNPVVTQATISSTICTSGYTKTVRPPVSYTSKLKVQQIQRYGYSDTNPTHYQQDHAISLEVGGSGSAPVNEWPEPIVVAHQDDQVENQINKSICSGQETLIQGQAQELQLKVSHGYKPELSK